MLKIQGAGLAPARLYQSSRRGETAAALGRGDLVRRALPDLPGLVRREYRGLDVVAMCSEAGGRKGRSVRGTSWSRCCFSRAACPVHESLESSHAVSV